MAPQSRNTLPFNGSVYYCRFNCLTCKSSIEAALNSPCFFLLFELQLPTYFETDWANAIERSLFYLISKYCFRSASNLRYKFSILFKRLWLLQILNSYFKIWNLVISIRWLVNSPIVFDLLSWPSLMPIYDLWRASIWSCLGRSSLETKLANFRDSLAARRLMMFFWIPKFWLNFLEVLSPPSLLATKFSHLVFLGIWIETKIGLTVSIWKAK